MAAGHAVQRQIQTLLTCILHRTVESSSLFEFVSIKASINDKSRGIKQEAKAMFLKHKTSGGR